MGNVMDDKLLMDAASPYLTKGKMKEVLGTFSEEEQRYIILRFGLEDNVKRTSTEVGVELKLEKTELQELDMNLVRKMRHPSRLKVVG